MKDVNVFFIESKLELEANTTLAYQSLEKQLKEHELSYSIKKFAPTELPTSSDSSLTLVFLENSSVYPEISGGRHMIAVRFLKRDAEGKFLQTEESVEFKLSLC